MTDTEQKVCPSDGIETIRKPTGTERDPSAAIGTVLASRYEIERLVGDGPHGRVYEARQTALRRPVVVRMLSSPRPYSDADIQSFFKQAQAASHLEHPNILRVFDFGVSEEGVPYVISEFAPFETLQQRLDRVGALDEVDAVRITRSICRSLIDAHRERTVHGDLRPEKAFMCEVKGVGDIVKVSDFNIARIVHGTLVPRETRGLTLIPRTSPYSAPEQVHGGPVGPWTDLYAVGAILHHGIFGTPPPFPEEASDSMPEPEIPTKGVRGELHPETVSVLTHLLQPDTLRRPSSASSVAQDLASILRATSPSPSARAAIAHVMPARHTTSDTLLGVEPPAMTTSMRWVLRAAAAVVLFSLATLVADFSLRQHSPMMFPLADVSAAERPAAEAAKEQARHPELVAKDETKEAAIRSEHSRASEEKQQ